jgi:hypothetical protein
MGAGCPALVELGQTVPLIRQRIISLAAEILRVLGDSTGLSLAGIAESVGLARSSVHSYIFHDIRYVVQTVSLNHDCPAVFTVIAERDSCLLQ